MRNYSVNCQHYPSIAVTSVLPDAGVQLCSSAENFWSKVPSAHGADANGFTQLSAALTFLPAGVFHGLIVQQSDPLPPPQLEQRNPADIQEEGGI